jgi:VWFA-related protein
LDFTTDHGTILSLLDRYKSHNASIQTALETNNSGVRRATGAGLGVDVAQDEIDGIFRDSSDQPVREFGPPATRDVGGMGARMRFTVVRFFDLLHLYGAIEYLRLKDGEKHVIYLAEQGATYLSTRHSRLATSAADSRVALHIVQTGGFGENQSIVSGSRFSGLATIPTSTAAYYNTSASARELTEATGGLSFFYTDLHKAFSRIADALRVDYLLGYIPSNENWHGEYRHVDVHVNRPGVTVIYRHGYDAVTTPPPWNDRETMTDVRMSEARSAVRPLRGITLQLKTTRGTDGKVAVELQIEPSQVAFTTVEHRHLASLDVAIWVTDRQGDTVGTMTDRIELQLTDESYAKLVKQNMLFTRSVVVSGTPFEIRAGVYDYDNDRVGAVSKRIQ